VSGPPTPADSPLTMEDALASPLYRDLTTAKLAVSDPAFDFELPELDLADGSKRTTGRSVRLSGFAGDRPVALIFGSYI
jgi:hypothetical protein